MDEKSEKLLDKPILEKQIKTEDGKQINENNATEYAKELVSETKISFKNTVGNDGVKRKKFSITLPLAPDHLKERAKIYLPLVLKYSQKYNLLVSLVLAVIHTESYYNPKARSYVPAYGLMQLVPRSGARDAYNFVYKDDKLLRSSYLYNPENNIELGVAYLYLLKNRYFKGVKDDISKDFCAIAGYNTGPGNVCKAFTGKTKLKSAIAKINTMSSTEVYNRLRNHLPYDETKNYIKKVRDRMPLYEE